MIKFQSDKISEFMTGYIVESASVNSSSIKVFIPSIMVDRTAKSSPDTINIENIFKSKEVISLNSSITSMNYISIVASNAYKTIYVTKTFSSGEKVIVYSPKFNIDAAMIVPLL